MIGSSVLKSCTVKTRRGKKRATTITTHAQPDNTKMEKKEGNRER